MPIRWSAMRVMEAAEMIEKHIDASIEPLQCARETALAALEIDNLPQYIGQRLRSLLSELDRTIGDYPTGRGSVPRSKLKAIRDDVPKEALEAERKLSAYGGRPCLPVQTC
jgi:hypothetical protein